MVHVSMRQGGQLAGDQVLYFRLERGIDRRLDRGLVALFQQADPQVRRQPRSARSLQLKRFLLGQLGFFPTESAGRDHPVQNAIPGLDRPLPIAAWVESLRSRQDPDQGGRLAGRQPAGVLAEHLLGRSLDARRTRAEPGAIQPLGEDFVLRQVQIEPDGTPRLDALSEPAGRPLDDQPSRLLGQRAAPLDHFPRAPVGGRGSTDGAQIHALVAVEAVVLGREQGIDDHRRHVVELHPGGAASIGYPTLQQHGSVPIEDPTVLLGLHPLGRNRPHQPDDPDQEPHGGGDQTVLRGHRSPGYPARMWFFLLATAFAQDRPELPYEMVSADYPIRVHWEREQDDRLAGRVMEAAELAWQVQVNELGFRAPVLPDGVHGPELDYYLIELGYAQAWASPDAWDDTVKGDGYSGTPAYMAIDWNLPEDMVDAFVAHEFNHVLQYGTDYNEWTLTIWEATATAAQTWTLGEEGAWDADVADFQSDPYLNSLGGDSYFIWYELYTAYFYEYGAALWMMHLDQVVGDGDGSAGPEIWDAVAQEGLPNEPDVIEAFAQVAGEPIGPALNKLARTRFLVADDWDARGLPDARDWPIEAKVPATDLDGDELPLTHIFAPALMPTGMGFLDMDLEGFDAGVKDPHLIVDVTSETALRSAVIVLWWAEDGTVGHVEDAGEVAFVELPIEGLTRVAVAVTNLEDSDWDGDRFLYRDGDQQVYLAFGEGPGTHTPGSGEPRACGCDSAGSAAIPLGWLFAVVLLGRRRD